MYNKILVPLDGSKLSECSLDHVKEIAVGCHVPEVVLLTVFESPFGSYTWPASQTQAYEMAAETEERKKQAQQKAEDYLAKVSQDLKLSGVSVGTVVIGETEAKRAAEIILDYAHENNFDLIVMSTHGRSGVTRWAFGSVSGKIIQQSQVPVLIVAPKGCRIR
jgi:nucleotide-binding universal stress UspA family protein